MKTRNRSRSRSRQRSRSRTRKLNNSPKPKKHRFGFNPAKDLSFQQKTEIIREIEGKKSLENMVLNNPRENWDWTELSSNPNISREFVEANPELPWAWDMIFIHKNIDANFIRRFQNRVIPRQGGDQQTEVYRCLSFNKYLPLSFVRENTEMPWHWKFLSTNPVITIDFVLEYPELPWNWDWLSRNPSLSMNFVERHLTEFPWNWYLMSENTSLTMDFVERHLNVGWYWDFMSENPSLTMNFVKRHLDKEWNWQYISKNSCLTMEFLEEHIHDPRFPWVWNYGVSDNPNLTEEFVINHYPEIPQKWNVIIDSRAAQISLRYFMSNGEIPDHLLSQVLSIPFTWYCYVIGDYDELPPIDYRVLSSMKGLYDDRVFNIAYMNELLYRESHDMLSDLVGEDVTENVIGEYITGRRMYKRKSR